jgi:hypothetical protein
MKKKRIDIFRSLSRKEIDIGILIIILIIVCYFIILAIIGKE